MSGGGALRRHEPPLAAPRLILEDPVLREGALRPGGGRGKAAEGEDVTQHRRLQKRLHGASIICILEFRGWLRLE